MADLQQAHNNILRAFERAANLLQMAHGAVTWCTPVEEVAEAFRVLDDLWNDLNPQDGDEISDEACGAAFADAWKHLGISVGQLAKTAHVVAVSSHDAACRIAQRILEAAWQRRRKNSYPGGYFGDIKTASTIWANEIIPNLQQIEQVDSKQLVQWMEQEYARANNTDSSQQEQASQDQSDSAAVADFIDKLKALSEDERSYVLRTYLFLYAQTYYNLTEASIAPGVGYVDTQLNSYYLRTIKAIKDLLAKPELQGFPGGFEPIVEDVFPSDDWDIGWDDCYAPRVRDFLSRAQAFLEECDPTIAAENDAVKACIAVCIASCKTVSATAAQHRKQAEAFLRKAMGRAESIAQKRESEVVVPCTAERALQDLQRATEKHRLTFLFFAVAIRVDPMYTPSNLDASRPPFPQPGLEKLCADGIPAEDDEGQFLFKYRRPLDLFAQNAFHHFGLRDGDKPRVTLPDGRTVEVEGGRLPTWSVSGIGCTYLEQSADAILTSCRSLARTDKIGRFHLLVQEAKEATHDQGQPRWNCSVPVRWGYLSQLDRLIASIKAAEFDCYAEASGPADPCDTVAAQQVPVVVTIDASRKQKATASGEVPVPTGPGSHDVTSTDVQLGGPYPWDDIKRLRGVGVGGRLLRIPDRNDILSAIHHWHSLPCYVENLEAKGYRWKGTCWSAPEEGTDSPSDLLVSAALHHLFETTKAVIPPELERRQINSTSFLRASDVMWRFAHEACEPAALWGTIERFATWGNNNLPPEMTVETLLPPDDLRVIIQAQYDLERLKALLEAEAPGPVSREELEAIRDLATCGLRMLMGLWALISTCRDSDPDVMHRRFLDRSDTIEREASKLDDLYTDWSLGFASAPKFRHFVQSAIVKQGLPVEPWQIAGHWVTTCYDEARVIVGDGLGQVQGAIERMRQKLEPWPKGLRPDRVDLHHLDGSRKIAEIEAESAIAIEALSFLQGQNPTPRAIPATSGHGWPSGSLGPNAGPGIGLKPVSVSDAGMAVVVNKDAAEPPRSGLDAPSGHRYPTTCVEEAKSRGCNSWQVAQERAEAYIKNHPWPGVNALTQHCRCHHSVLKKAVEDSARLKKARAAQELQKPRPVAEARNDDPSRYAVADEALRQLIEYAPEGDRAQLHTPEMREQLAGMKPQDLTSLVEDARKQAETRMRAQARKGRRS